MKISERIFLTIESWQATWKDRLRGWMASWLAFGIEVFMDVLGNAASPKLTPIVDRLIATGKVPPELQPLLDEIKNPKGEIGAIFAQSAGSALVGGAIGRVIDAILLPVAYMVNSATRNVLLSQGQLLALWLRDKLPEDKLNEYLSWAGLTDDDIGGVKELTKFIPSPAEQVNWLAREVFEPEMVSRYGLDSELPVYEETQFKAVGVTPEQMTNFWRAHWTHASWGQVIEMLRRGQLTEEQVWDWFRVVEIPPFWREKLINISYAVPTRVDVRRWWDMRTITEERLREVYAWQGYHGKDLNDYVLWTKVYVAFPDLIARFKNGWITEDDVKAELTGLGMPEARLNEMIQTKIKPEAPERVEPERALTKSEIYRGVKKEIISWDEGIELLMDMNYGRDEAEYILEVNVGAITGSPETYSEFKKWTQTYRKAQGLSYREIPQELVDAETDLKTARIELQSVIEQGMKEPKLSPYAKAVSDAEYRYRQLLLKWQTEGK